MKIQNKNDKHDRFDTIGAYVWIISTLITAGLGVTTVMLINLYTGG